MQQKILIAAAVLGSLSASMQAAERVTLRNGFEMRCDHHAEVGGHVLLYPTAGEDNYIVLAPKEIASVESVPDLPPPVATQQKDANDGSGGSTAAPNSHF